MSALGVRRDKRLPARTGIAMALGRLADENHAVLAGWDDERFAPMLLKATAQVLDADTRDQTETALVRLGGLVQAELERIEEDRSR